jgi:hypothetical protein
MTNVKTCSEISLIAIVLDVRADTGSNMLSDAPFVQAETETPLRASLKCIKDITIMPTNVHIGAYASLRHTCVALGSRCCLSCRFPFAANARADCHPNDEEEAFRCGEPCARVLCACRSQPSRAHPQFSRVCTPPFPPSTLSHRELVCLRELVCTPGYPNTPNTTLSK